MQFFTFQVMVLGDSGVGKTCLLIRFRDDTFLGGNYISTVGVDFRVRIIPFLDLINHGFVLHASRYKYKTTWNIVILFCRRTLWIY